MLNRTIITGRLTKEPEVKTTVNEHSVASFTLAVDRNYKDRNGERQTDFINVTAWNALARTCESYLRKGSLCTVSGSIRTGSYTKDEVKHYTFQVVADEIHFISSPSLTSHESTEGPIPGDLLEGFEEITEDLPF